MGAVGFDAHFRRCRCKHSTRRPKCAKETTGLIHHSDHGSQYVSIVYNERLAEHGIAASTGTVGDSYDNALAENVNGAESGLLVGVLRNGGRAGFRIGGKAGQLALSGPAAGPLIRLTTRWRHV